MAAGDKDAKRRSRSDRSEGAMTLFEHLREFQSRLFKSALAILAAAGLSWFFYDQIFNVITAPFMDVVAQAKANGQEVVLAVNGVTDAFTLQLQVILIAGVIFALPIWLYQLWRFLAPGLKGVERRWAYGFVFSATPLFILGTVIAYMAMPSLLHLLLGFTPTNVANIININTYLAFTIQLMLFFGVGAIIPAIFVMLNFAGVLSGERLLKSWRWLLIGVMTFAAVATPSTDPVSMLVVAAPFMVIVSIAVIIMVINDRRRARKAARQASVMLADDQASIIEPPEIVPEDLVPSPIQDDLP
jgi:sec-independent protein translocase protein TatC